MVSKVTYIWMDGTEPTRKLRCKMKVIPTTTEVLTIDQIPEWGFDGSSTYQAKGSQSDLLLLPVYMIQDPMTVENDYLVLCEVFTP
ncbi:MAG: glutamine synthetase beta-grasp domain-containing protein, partial [Coxiellaceae bacterium]|nr:glutamine synthetase beta-grasp domain-containing protein [Coxiellaceae bacterium]